MTAIRTSHEDVLTDESATKPAATTADTADTVVSLDAAVSPAQPPPPVQAPNDDELYACFGPQRRWVMLLMTTSFLLAGSSVVRFSMRSVWLVPLLIALALNLIGAFFSLSSGQRRRRFTRESHDALITDWSPKTTPSVDVFLPTCGEPLEILENTYRHVAAMQWPGTLRVLVLDDGAREEVRRLAGSYDFDYFVRPNRGEMKKAGNLKYAFGKSEGDLIAIFDADFCPRPDFLAHLVPYFDDESTGIVQSPQSFDTDPAMGWLQRTAGATQELFYRWVQPSRDRAGAPICVGTNAVYRRAALEKTGGFAQIEHSEDVHTGIALMRAGYRTTYVPIQVAKGLCPDDLAAFMNQQYRWCNGSITLLKSGQAQRNPLDLRQRMCFWAGFMYYITTAVNVFVAHLPALIMAVFYPRDIVPSHFLPFLLGVWVYFVLMPRVSEGRWRFEVLRVQMVYSFCHAVAIGHKLTGRTAGWVATGAVKRGNPLARTISRVGFSWLMIVTATSWIAMAVDIHLVGFAKLWPMMLLLIGYTYLSAPLIVEFGRVLMRERSARRVQRTSAVGVTA